MNSINYRIKQVRIEANLNQKEFAKLLGMTQSGVSYMEQPQRNVSDITIKSICNQFSIEEDWLRYGIGPRHISAPSFSLDSFAKEGEMSALELKILKRYFALDPKVRKEALSYFLDNLEDEDEKDESEMTFEELIAECPKTPEELERLYPPVKVKPKVI